MKIGWLFFFFLLVTVTKIFERILKSILVLGTGELRKADQCPDQQIDINKDFSRSKAVLQVALVLSNTPSLKLYSPC